MQKKLELLIQDLLGFDIKLNEPLAKHVPLKIGGPADIFCQVSNIDDLVEVVGLARKHAVPLTILGSGTNILIADKGIRGLVVQNCSDRIEILGKTNKRHINKAEVPEFRWDSDRSKGTFRGIEFKDLNYDESDEPKVKVVMDSGVNLPRAIKYLLDNEITGLQWFAGIPGTIGGAVYNNIHGGTRFLSEFLNKVKILDKHGKIKELSVDDLEADYDKSKFHESGDIILQAEFNLSKGDVQRAKYTAEEWFKRKLIQPRNSPGCIFKNISNQDKKRLGYPTTSTGYIVEHILVMLGFQIGGARVYDKHGNFIINTGQATADDFMQVINTIRERTKQEAGIDLQVEIGLLGFE